MVNLLLIHTSSFSIFIEILKIWFLRYSFEKHKLEYKKSIKIWINVHFVHGKIENLHNNYNKPNYSIMKDINN